MTGELTVGARGWKTSRDDLVRRFLEAPVPDGSPLSRLSLIEHERAARWLDQRSLTRCRLFAAVAGQWSTPQRRPEGVAELLEPLIWLTGQIGEGTKVSRAGTLNRPLVQEIDERYGFGLTGKPPLNESHVFQVTELRELAQRLGLVRRRGLVLAATSRGRQLVADPPALWDCFVAHALALREFDRFTAETWLAIQLVDPSPGFPHDRQVVAQAANEHGWHQGQGRSIDEHAVGDGINTIAWSFRLVGLLGADRRGFSLNAAPVLSFSGVSGRDRRRRLEARQSSRWMAYATAKPTVVSTPTSLPPCSYASGIIVSASIVRMAPAAKVSTNATSSGEACWNSP
jgi:hypothetical protein